MALVHLWTESKPNVRTRLTACGKPVARRRAVFDRAVVNCKDCLHASLKQSESKSKPDPIDLLIQRIDRAIDNAESYLREARGFADELSMLHEDTKDVE